MGKIKHGMRNTRLYNIWKGVKARCLNPNNKAYERYGGRGITICEEWKDDFLAFYTWAIANGYSEDLQLDRKDNNKGYNLNNCRFITCKQNNNNKRNNRLIIIDGVTKTATQWADEQGFERHALIQRLKKGWEGEDLLKPIHSKSAIIFNGETKTLTELSKETGIKQVTLWRRYNIQGLRDNELIQPLQRKK